MDAAAVLWLVVGVLAIAVFLRLTRRARPDEESHRPTSTIGAGAAGTIYDFLNQDKRNALEIVVEGRAAAHDPEDKDGNLPDLEEPKRTG